ncbi:type II CRISPR RNA-guided endonuclease Cas9 [Niabella aquatica]
MSKTILGLDLGANSIGWALIQNDFENKEGKILGMGSRIIPMTQDIKDEFGKGNSVSQTADRTRFRSTRRLRERHLLRRYRLHRVLNVLGFLPEHYANELDFENRLGQFVEETEPKIAWKKNKEGKFEFLFQQSFHEMLEDFKANGQDIKTPYDWTIYYLRKKAITHKISKEELAWLILNFNQKRGYYQLRGEEEEEKANKLVEFYSLKVVDVVPDPEVNRKGEIWYSIHLENGWIYRRSSKIDLYDWNNKIRDFIVTTELNDDGSVKTDKEGNERRSFRAPGEEDWTLIKKKTEQDIEHSGKTVGTYIYENLLLNPKQKIKGKLVRTIERKFYKEELETILKKQIELQSELFTDDLYSDCVRELYRNNEVHQIQLSKRDFVHLFVNDIIFYQRPLKSQKSSINNCALEYRVHKAKGKDGKEFDKKEYLKAIPKSHPLYQEFRIWQWMYNLKIFRREDEADVTQIYINSDEDRVRLFDFLMQQKEVDHKNIIKYLLEPQGLKGKNLTTEISKYRWNYVYDNEKDESKKYPMNETGYELRRRLAKVENIPDDFLTTEKELQLWHLIYSVTDKVEFEKALHSFAAKHHLDENSFVENFRKFPPFKSEYGSFSEKAIKKLLPLMRTGKYWNWKNIDLPTQKRIANIINGEFDETIKNRVREKAVQNQLQTEIDFQGLPLWLAQYVVYDRHSEAEITGKWQSIEELKKYLEEFKQHSLRNPIVEQVVMETLRVVGDIWEKYGSGKKDFFNEIHVELGREMRNTAEERKRLTAIVSDNEATNLRLKELLIELKENSDGKLNVENVRPHSPMQQEALKIFEDGALSTYDVPDDILKISKTAQPSRSELQRYKLWLEQRYRSPYTGKIIPLGKLFTSEYEIEHIIPQSRYFDDSFSNKIICESAVNKLKDKQLGLAFIKKHSGEIVQDGDKQFKVLTESEYKDFVKNHYSKNQSKKRKLLLEEIPDAMIERQLNDTRYTSKFISNILSNTVRNEGGKDEEFRSKNVLPGNGKITQTLRQDWGLNDIWNELILPRFERMNQLSDSDQFTSKNTEGKTIPTVPLELSKGFQKKRIDHRHHALDALVIACATREHIQYLNNENAKSQKYHLQMGLAQKLRKMETIEVSKWKKADNDVWIKSEEKIEKRVPKDYLKPWETFTQDTKAQLGKIVVSFKQNVRVINKTSNKYEKFVEKNGKITSELVSQTKGDSWAIRKPMHKDTVSGKIDLPRIKVPKGKMLTATRKNVDSSFDLKIIESITDTGIQKILKNYLDFKGNNPEIAFSPEGLEEMNKNIAQFNDGKAHQPIYKARIFELGSKFALGETGNKKHKYVEAAKGTNLFFAVYADNDGKRSYDTIPLNIVIERQKQGLGSVPDTNEKGHQLLFYLSPNDLVYVPTEDEKEGDHGIDFSKLSKEQVNRIYKIVSFTGNRLYAVPVSVATVIVNKFEYTQLNKIEFIKDKELCFKLDVDRLGNVSKA